MKNLFFEITGPSETLTTEKYCKIFQRILPFQDLCIATYRL